MSRWVSVTGRPKNWKGRGESFDRQQKRGLTAAPAAAVEKRRRNLIKAADRQTESKYDSLPLSLVAKPTSNNTGICHEPAGKRRDAKILYERMPSKPILGYDDELGVVFSFLPPLDEI